MYQIELELPGQGVKKLNGWKLKIGHSLGSSLGWHWEGASCVRAWQLIQSIKDCIRAQANKERGGNTDNATLTYFWKRVNQKKATKQKPISRCGQTANKAVVSWPTGGPGVLVTSQLSLHYHEDLNHFRFSSGLIFSVLCKVYINQRGTRASPEQDLYLCHPEAQPLSRQNLQSHFNTQIGNISEKIRRQVLIY